MFKLFGYRLINEREAAELVDRCNHAQWEADQWKEHRGVAAVRMNDLISENLTLNTLRSELVKREAVNLSKINRLERAIERIEIKANNGHGYAPSFRSLAVLNDISEECAKTLAECRNIK